MVSKSQNKMGNLAKKEKALPKLQSAKSNKIKFSNKLILTLLALGVFGASLFFLILNRRNLQNTMQNVDEMFVVKLLYTVGKKEFDREGFVIGVKLNLSRFSADILSKNFYKSYVYVGDPRFANNFFILIFPNSTVARGYFLNDSFIKNFEISRGHIGDFENVSTQLNFNEGVRFFKITTVYDKKFNISVSTYGSVVLYKNVLGIGSFENESACRSFTNELATSIYQID